MAAVQTKSAGPLSPATSAPAVDAPEISYLAATTPATAVVAEAKPDSTSGMVTRLRWSGEVPSQKWTNFYTKVLSRFAVGKGLKLIVSAEVADPTGISQQKIDEMKVALRELGLADSATVE